MSLKRFLIYTICQQFSLSFPKKENIYRTHRQQLPLTFPARCVDWCCRRRRQPLPRRPPLFRVEGAPPPPLRHRRLLGPGNVRVHAAPRPRGRRRRGAVDVNGKTQGKFRRGGS